MRGESYPNITETLIGQKVSFLNDWKVFDRKDNLYILSKKIKNKTMYSPMYIHSFQYIIGNDYNECDKFNLKNTNPVEMECINDKIRYYRLKNGLKQDEVAESIGIDRTTYINYERKDRIYPKELMIEMSKVYNVDVNLLLDDYHKFIYFGQGKNIKKIRRELRLNQNELASALGVSLIVIKRAEQERVRFLKKNYLKLIDYYSKTMML